MAYSDTQKYAFPIIWRLFKGQNNRRNKLNERMWQCSLRTCDFYL